jgi:hypothetical protein
MADQDIPADVQDFILKYVESVAYIEALMLLRRVPDHPWDSAALAGRLFVSAGDAERILNIMGSQGLVIEKEGRYRFGCADEQIINVIGKLSQVYSHALIPVTNLIHAKRPDRVQNFADAFNLRKRD